MITYEFCLCLLDMRVKMQFLPNNNYPINCLYDNYESQQVCLILSLSNIKTPSENLVLVKTGTTIFQTHLSRLLVLIFSN